MGEQGADENRDEGIEIDLSEMRYQTFDLLRHMLRHLQPQAEKLIHLPHEDDHRDAAREARRDRVRDEFEQRPQQNQHHAPPSPWPEPKLDLRLPRVYSRNP